MGRAPEPTGNEFFGGSRPGLDILEKVLLFFAQSYAGLCHVKLNAAREILTVLKDLQSCLWASKDVCDYLTSDAQVSERTLLSLKVYSLHRLVLRY